MQRRTFLKTTGAAMAGVAAGLPVAFSLRATRRPFAGEPFLPVVGSAFLRTADALADLHRASFDEVVERITHFHLPPHWQSIEVLGIAVPQHSRFEF